MAFKLTIETGDAAFSHDPAGELQDVIDDVVALMHSGWTSRSILDSNGNTIGEWSYEPTALDDDEFDQNPCDDEGGE